MLRSGIPNSIPRCGSVVNSVFIRTKFAFSLLAADAFNELLQSKFAFWLRIRSEFCVSSASVAFKIRILAATRADQRGVLRDAEEKRWTATEGVVGKHKKH